MKHAGITDDRRCSEPRFDPPPSFVGLHDRRLGERIAAEWADYAPRGAIRSASIKLPPARTFGDAVASREGYCVWLARRDGVVTMTEVGALIARAFAVTPGASDASPFARALAVACERSLHRGQPALFEGGFAKQPGAPSTLLTRGVVVPLAAEAGVGRACAVVSWTETLAPAENGRIQRELVAALREMAVRDSKTPAVSVW